MDLNKLTMGDKVIAGSGIALFVFSFFNWLGIEVNSGPFSASESKSGWGFTLTLIAILIGIAMVVIVALKAFGVDLPQLGSVTWGQVLLAMGAVSFVFVLIKVIVGPNLANAADIAGVDKTRGIGIFLGLLATAGLVAGGYLRMQEDKAGGGATPPPPAA
jgi:hypothetical protein